MKDSEKKHKKIMKGKFTHGNIFNIFYGLIACKIEP